MLVLAFVGLISAAAGLIWGLAPIALLLVTAAVVRLWWLPRHGINGFTGEPRDKYYELRGWTRQAVAFLNNSTVDNRRGC